MEKKIWRFKRVLFMLPMALMVLVILSCGPTRRQSIKAWEKHEWKKVKASKNTGRQWKIYRRKVRNTAFWEYKIVGEISCSPKQGVERFRKDIKRLANGADPKKYPSYQVLQESKDSLLTYVIHNEPFPFKDTEMSVRYVFHVRDEKDTAVEWTESWSDCDEPHKKLKRVEMFRGSLRLSSRNGSQTQMVQTMQFDPKGMPMWLVNPTVIKFLKKELKKY